MAFDPRYPPTSNSLNRLRLEAESLPLPANVRGKAAYELLSSLALDGLIQLHTGDVAAFYEQAALGAEWAVELAQTLGTRLGTLLAVLARNDTRTHKANPDKPAAYWAHWAGIRAVCIGGGMARGRVGAIIAAQAQATVRSLADAPGYQVVQAEHPQYLPLLGAARTVQACNRASILDFGGSYVKRAIAHYSSGWLSRLQLRASLPTDLPADDDDARLMFERMVDIMAQSYAEVDSPTMPISIAAYVDQCGQPRLSQSGIYMRLARLTPDVPAAFSQAISERLRTPVEVRLLHDGTAAALAYAPLEQAAVIMLGTALGSGYPVARPGLALRPVSPTVTIG